jgi:membrane-associated phospholipid phosphatase
MSPRQQKEYYWSFFLSLIVIGTIFATLFSSVGPIYYDEFYHDDKFVPMVRQLQKIDLDGDVLHYANYLLRHFKNGTAALGSGISAMPSVHVAVAVLNAYFYSSVNRKLGAFMWAFAALIMFGSVYTGWHYAVDGYVSIIVVSLVWFAVKKAHTK